MEASEHLGALTGAAERLLAAARGNLARPVASCPGWDVADLVVHVGLTWGWAAAIVETGERAERGQPPATRREPALLDWARGRAELVATTLRAADLEAACWTFGPPPTKRFWVRRQALETVLHAWDAERAAAHDGPVALPDPELAADGVDELLSVALPQRLGRRHGSWDGEAVHLHRTDGEGEWLVRLGPDGAVALERSHGKGDLALRGSAAALWLWATNRGGAGDLGIEVFGDAALLERWRDEIPF